MNMHIQQFVHFDNWLARRVRLGHEQDLKLLQPLAGFAHRMSQAQDRSEPRFGGAWLPPPPGRSSLCPDKLDELALAMSAPLVRDWVRQCRMLAGRVVRGDKPPVALELPFEDMSRYGELGVYVIVQGVPTLTLGVPLQVDMFSKPSWGHFTAIAGQTSARSVGGHAWQENRAC